MNKYEEDIITNLKGLADEGSINERDIEDGINNLLIHYKDKINKLEKELKDNIAVIYHQHDDIKRLQKEWNKSELHRMYTAKELRVVKKQFDIKYRIVNKYMVIIEKQNKIIEKLEEENDTLPNKSN